LNPFDLGIGTTSINLSREDWYVEGSSPSTYHVIKTFEGAFIMDWIKYIKPEELSEDYQIIIDAIGLENTIKLSQAIPGIYIYLKNPNNLFKPAKVRYILDKYANASPATPFNHRRIAIKTGLSIREIYDIIKDRKK
jgi:hypothetical protein